MVDATPYYQDAAVSLYHGDSLSVLRGLPAASVQTCVTSPPYWGLRDYGTATWAGGDAGCDHLVRLDPKVESSTLGGGKATIGYQREGFKSKCSRCGARRIDAQLGLEKTPEEYAANLVAVFREVRRVLRDDGTLWLNLGDSYCNVRTHMGGGAPTNTVHRGGSRDGTEEHYRPNRSEKYGLKEKDLVGIPWRVAFALQADGWYLRSDIIWAKPNPMPESVTDRPTKAHEYLFLLAKAQRYYYDAEAIKEPAISDRGSGQGFVRPERLSLGGRGQAAPWTDVGGSRNRRTVWEIATQPYPEAHFATFPVDLVKPCVLAGCPAGGAVLDTFAGSGTTCYVAKELGRHAIGIDLNAKYLDLAAKRLRQDVLAF